MATSWNHASTNFNLHLEHQLDRDFFIGQLLPEKIGLRLPPLSLQQNE